MSGINSSMTKIGSQKPTKIRVMVLGQNSVGKSGNNLS